MARLTVFLRNRRAPDSESYLEQVREDLRGLLSELAAIVWLAKVSRSQDPVQ